MSHVEKKLTRRERRLQQAKSWVKRHKGQKYIVRKYKREFHVSSLCAIKELQMFGIHFEKEYIENVKRIEKEQAEKRKRKKLKKEFAYLDDDSDETFAFIAGYTSGGAPYGITWEEMAEIEKRDKELGIDINSIDVNAEDLPF